MQFRALVNYTAKFSIQKQYERHREVIDNSLACSVAGTALPLHGRYASSNLYKYFYVFFVVLDICINIIYILI